MKHVMVALAIVFTCLMASCTQRTCPTYTKEIKELPTDQAGNVLKEKV